MIVGVPTKESPADQLTGDNRARSALPLFAGRDVGSGKSRSAAVTGRICYEVVQVDASRTGRVGALVSCQRDGVVFYEPEYQKAVRRCDRTSHFESTSADRMSDISPSRTSPPDTSPYQICFGRAKVSMAKTLDSRKHCDRRPKKIPVANIFQCLF